MCVDFESQPGITFKEGKKIMQRIMKALPGKVPIGKMKALSQNGLSIPGSSRLLIKGIISTVRVWPDDFRNGDYDISGFQERSQTGGLQSFIAVLRLFFSSGIPVRPVVRQKEFPNDFRFTS
jgi:hypothetical protein